MATRYVTITFAEKPRYAFLVGLTNPRELMLPYSISISKYIERRIIRAWKSMTHKPQRKSILMEDFVILNARRRSVMFS